MSKQLSSLQAEPKYLKLAGHLREQISSGTLQAGNRLPSFPEFKLQGLGQDTVERAFAVLERENLIERRNGRGVFVADPKRRTPTGLIGLVAHNFDRQKEAPYFVQVMQGIMDVLQRAEKGILLLDNESSAGWERVDGIMMLMQNHNWHYPSEWLWPGLPVVSLIDSDENQSSVTADDRGGAQQAVEHLLSLGHRRIACLMAEDTPLLRSRLDGYSAALQVAGIQPQPDWVRWSQRIVNLRGAHRRYRQEGYETMHDWLRESWQKAGCTALLAQNDYMAAGALLALQQADIRVPEEVSVIGFDGTEVGEYTSPPLTSVEVPLYEIGATAIKTLLSQVEKRENRAQKIVLPTRLKVRESSAAPLIPEEM